ncbi:MAG TPA: copper amine oxidase N-terminal domain-containing protein, partial [Magnetospirillaceae bacterium]|nr:copper amine oxidase N-terminal domain-containing protein [Magnetospirillaceae bacterium]
MAAASAALILVATIVPAKAADDAIVVNGTRLPADAVAQVDGRTYVALRPVGEALGADVRYDGKTKQVTLTTVLVQLVFKIDDPTVSVNGQPQKIEAPAQSIGGKVMLPLRGLATALGATLRQ